MPRSANPARRRTATASPSALAISSWRKNGWRNPAYTEADGAAYMKQSELVIGVDLGLGRAKRTVWTCDLTSRYIEINADYRS